MNTRSAASAIDFMDALRAVGATLLEDKWLGNHTPHRVICSNGHHCAPRPDRIKQGRNVCKTCSGRDSADSERRFKERLTTLGATLLEDTWLGNKTPHRVRCSNGHITSPLPGNVLSGHGICQPCMGYDKATGEISFRHNLEKWGACLLEGYKNADSPHHVKCVNGHDCYPRPYNMHYGSGPCRKCVGKVWDAFYIVESETEIKFGVTSGDPQIRLSRHKLNGFDYVRLLLTGLEGETAAQLEQTVIRVLTDSGIGPTRRREYYSREVLSAVLGIVNAEMSVV